MPIVINRATGEAAVPVISPTQQEDLLACIVKAYIEAHPEVLAAAGE